MEGQIFQSYLEPYNQLHQSVTQFENLLENVNQQLTKYAGTAAERGQQDASIFEF